ncbi:serine hydrolase domain-containing protein [Stenotrophomonas terrae]|uniref:serine hydrolase domain-containing protein n=1 Tax=Stenotrophomonas terrae TaxID=405446 RepID=UPI00070F0C29|nr:serine hydrolase domain-containing protein [Stenotrophomonas terrae]
MKTLLQILLLCIPALASAFAVAGDGTQLQADMQRILDEEGLQGVVWTTVTADGLAANGAAGVRDAATRSPMQTSTRVHVGSVTKAVLAIGVLRLVSQGRLSLDAPVAEVVPAIGFDNRWESTHPVRVRHLLAHTAGLENLRLGQFFSLKASADVPLAIASGTDRAPLRVLSQPGSRFSYSNLGYTVLGQVIEAVSGERYEAWMDREVLAALGMRDSTFTYTTQAGSQADPHLAMGHFEQARPAPAVPTFLRPAAQLTTTAGDMALFASFLLGDGSTAGQPFIEMELMEALTTPAGTEAVRAGLPLGHGLVLVGRDRHGQVGGCHPGNTVGYWAMLCVFPQQRRAFFVATNTDNEDGDNERLNQRLIEALALPPVAPFAPFAPPQVASPTSPSLPEWDGLYVRSPQAMPAIAPLQGLTEFIRVDTLGDKLRLRSLSRDAQLLQPFGNQLFRADSRVLPSHVLLMGEDGQPVLSDGLRSHVRVPAWRIIMPGLLLSIAMIGVVITMLAGVVLAIRGKLRWRSPVFLPALAGAALLLPIALLCRQSLLELGDRTVASITLASVSLLLPLALLAGTAVGLHGWRRAGRSTRLLTACLLATLPGVGLLVAWQLLPLRLWLL